MAKIFSNISKNTTTLSERYNNSSVSNDFTTFRELRNRVTGDLVPSQLLITNRPKKVYDQYTDPRLIALPLRETYQESQLITPEVITRSRRSAFYEGFRSGNRNATSSNEPRNNTFIEIKPYTQDGPNEAYVIDTSRMVENSQALPLISGPRDIRRMNRYFATNEGVQFKLRQQLLQAGATFGQARSYNPVSVETMLLNYSNANLGTPLIRVPRLIESEAMRKPELQGRLQKETVIDNQSKLALKFVGGTPPQRGGYSGALSGLFSSFGQNQLNNTNIRLFGTTLNLGQVGRQLDNLRIGLQTLTNLFNINDATLRKNQTAYDALYQQDLWPLMKETDGTVKNFETRKKDYIERARKAIKKASNINNLNKFTEEYPLDDYRSSVDYTDIVQANNGKKPKNSDIVSARYLKDPFNLDDRGLPVLLLSDLKSSSENTQNKDYITFKIAVPGVPELTNGIKFRAFIEDFNHSSKGQYNEVRYVGRPERFMTYKGMNRSATFSLYLIAFSETELSGMWTRCNMLNKLVFPIQHIGGFMMPPLVKLTIGNVLVDQPGYMENVDMRIQALEGGIPWDIDYELPMAIKLNFSFNIIEDGFITQQQDGGNLFIKDFYKTTLENVGNVIANIPNLNIPEPNLNSILNVPPPQFSSQPIGPIIEQRLQEQQSAANRSFRRQADIIDIRGRQG